MKATEISDLLEAKATYVYLNGRIRKLKPTANWNDFKAKYPDAVKTTKPPSEKTLMKWDSEGYSKAIDGCSPVEPDGHCKHGHPSWLLAMGYI